MNTQSFSRKEVARFLDVPLSTVNLWLYEKRFKTVITGNGEKRITGVNLNHIKKPISFAQDNQRLFEKKILVVEDHLNVSRALSYIIMGNGHYDVRVTDNGFAACFAIGEYDPDVILIDINLPDINGGVLCSELRNHPKFEHKHIVGMSGVLSHSQINSVMDSGFDDFLEKPFNSSEIFRALADLTAAQNMVS